MPSTKERTYFLILLLALSAALTFLVFQPFAVTVILAGVFAVLLYPLKLRVQVLFTKSEAFSAFITLVIGVLILVTPLALLSVLITQEIRDAYVSLSTGNASFAIEGVTTSVGAWLEPRFPGALSLSADIAGELQNYLRQVLEWVVNNVGSALSSVLAVVVRLVIFLITLYYLLKDGGRIKDLFTEKSPIAEADVENIFGHLSKTINGVIRGSLVIAVLQGCMAAIGFAIFGVPNPTLWGLTAAFGALIPTIGTGVVFVPAIIYLVAVGNVASAIGLLVWAVLLVGLIDNLLSPQLIGARAGLHPLLILLSIIGGLAFYGPAGIFLGPLTVSLLFALYHTYSNTKPSEV